MEKPMTLTMTSGDAAQALQDAITHHETLQARLSDGDLTVTSAQLTHAEAEVQRNTLALDGVLAAHCAPTCRIRWWLAAGYIGRSGQAGSASGVWSVVS